MKQSLIKFSNAHLSKLGFPVTDLENDFHDGVRLILLLGSLQGFFVPLYTFNMTPANDEEKLQNMKLAFAMLNESGIPPPRNRPYEIVHKDLKGILRIVYSLFIKYKI